MSKVYTAQTAAVACAVWWFIAPAVFAADEGTREPAPDKSAYNLFNPTPTRFLREMNTDGPGATESAYTVDAGHFQVEMTLVSYTSDRESFDGEDYRLDALAVGPITLKAGLLNQLDAQLVLEPYNRIYERTGTNRVTRQGFGDTAVRVKYNVWGNDRGPTALAVMPFVRFPTSGEGLGDRHVEGGLIVPFEAALPQNFFLGVTTRFAALHDETGSGWHPEFSNSLALGRDLFGNLFGYVEFFSVVSTERDADWVGTFDMGLIYGLSENVQLNAGVNIGVTRSADDWNPFIGLAWRF